MPRHSREQTGRRLPTSRIMLHFLLPYAAILLISLLVGVLVNRSTITLLEKEVVENNYAMLEQGRRSMDRRLSEIASITQFVAGSAPVLEFQDVTDPFKGRNVMQVLNTRDTLVDYALTNNFMLDYYIMYKDSDVVLGPHLTYRLSDFHNAVFHYPDLSEAAWRSLLFDEYHHNRYLPAREAAYRFGDRPILACLQSLDDNVTSKGVVLVLIDNAQMQSELAGLDTSGDGWAYIADEAGTILSSVSGKSGRPIPEKFDLPSSGHSFRQGDLLITHTTSDYNRWRYVVAQPYASVVHKVTQVNRTMLAVFFAFLLLGILIASLLAYWNSRPLTRLVQAIRGRDPVPADVRRAYSLIGNTLSNLMVNNEALQKNAEEQLPILRDSFFRRLYAGEIQTGRELETWMRHVDLNIEGNAFGVIILHLKGYHGALSTPILEELAMKRLLVREALRASAIDGIHAHDLDQDDIALLVACGSATREAWEAVVRTVLQCLSGDLLRDNRLILSCYVSDVHAALLDAATACKEAKSLLHITPPEGWNPTVWYWDVPRNVKSYHYPEEVETRLTNQVRAGLHDEAAALLEELARENLMERALPPAIRTVFLYELLGTLTKLQEQVVLGDRSLRTAAAGIATRLIEGAEPPLILFDTIRDLLLRICDGINERKKSHNSLLTDDILHHLEERYMDPNLCLAAVAQQFHLSEVYLSQFFKEQTGENFSVRLEQIRMKKALEFLTGTQRTIKEIAEMTGYNSSNTFCRAFKRIHHVSATQYREAVPAD